LLLCVLLASTLHAQNTAPFFAGAQSTAGVAVDASGNLFIADTGNNRIVKVTAAGVQSTVLSGTVLGKPLNAPNSIAVDSVDSIYITDSGNNRVLEVTAKGVASTLGS
jgi:sugar lactone lactonase YvrE